MELLEKVAKATYEQRMRNYNPGFDINAPIHPRLGMGPVLKWEDLPEEFKAKELAIAQVAIDVIKEHSTDPIINLDKIKEDLDDRKRY